MIATSYMYEQEAAASRASLDKELRELVEEAERISGKQIIVSRRDFISRHWPFLRKKITAMYSLDFPLEPLKPFGISECQNFNFGAEDPSEDFGICFYSSRQAVGAYLYGYLNGLRHTQPTEGRDK